MLLCGSHGRRWDHRCLIAGGLHVLRGRHGSLSRLLAAGTGRRLRLSPGIVLGWWKVGRLDAPVAGSCVRSVIVVAVVGIGIIVGAVIAFVGGVMGIAGWMSIDDSLKANPVGSMKLRRMTRHHGVHGDSIVLVVGGIGLGIGNGRFVRE